MTNVPEIRFKGYIGAWVQRKLGEVAEFSKGSGYTKGDLVSDGTPIILYGRLYTKYETVIEDVDTFVVMRDKSVVSSGGEVIVPSSGETAEDISRASVVGKAGVILGGDLNIVNPNLTIDPVFLAVTISNGNQQKELSKRAQGKSVVHISNSDLKDIILQLPTLPEQTAIGKFIRTLDDSHTLHKRKLDELREMKRGYLQQMFPEAGERVPRVRFKGFTDEWQVRRLGDVGEIITGSTPPTSDIENYSDDGMMWVTPTDINGITISTTAKRLSNKGQQIARIVPRGSILVTCIASIGKNTMAMSSAGFNQQINAVVPNESNDPYFLLTQSEMWSTYMKSNTASTTMQIVNKSEFSKISVLLPTSKLEQIAIGNFFHKLDERITAQTQYMEQLKQLKAAYLQKMFV